MPITIDDWACRSVQAKLDSYLDNELLTETNLDLAQHFETCANCAREALARRALRAKLQVAVRRTALPPELENRIRSRLTEPARTNRAAWLMAIAAAVVVCIAPWAATRDGALSPQALAALRVGLDDHVHCAVIRQRSNPARNTDKLAPQYKPILAAIRRRVPQG